MCSISSSAHELHAAYDDDDDHREVEGQVRRDHQVPVAELVPDVLLADRWTAAATHYKHTFLRHNALKKRGGLSNTPLRGGG